VKHIYSKEVVEDPKIHFWKVPRLGAFMAVPLIYKSCLSESALDNAIQDWLKIQDDIKGVQQEKEEWLAEQAQLKEEKIKAGETFEPEEREWPEVEEKYVVCIDTLGQDRELSEEQKIFILNTVVRFRDSWEKFEEDKLARDRDTRIRLKAEDATWMSDNLDKMKDDEEKYVEDRMEEQEEITDEEERAMLVTKLKMDFMAKQLLEEDFKKKFTDFRNYKVIKFGKFL
jgi:hypothetical protein